MDNHGLLPHGGQGRTVRPVRAIDLRVGDVVKMDDHVAFITKVTIPAKRYETDRMSCQGHRVRTVADLDVAPQGEPNVYVMDKRDIVVRMAWMVVAGKGAWLPVLVV